MGTVYSTLQKRDPHNQTLAILLLLFLTHAKKSPKLSLFHAYTFWNLSAFAATKLFNLKWERPIFCNSVAIFLSYKSASLDNYDGLFRRSHLKSHLVYAIGDFIVHTLPLLILAFELVQKKKYIRPQIGAFTLLSFVHFAYSQGGSLNVGQLYVPHDHLFTWLNVISGTIFCPYVINNLISKNYERAFRYLLLTIAPLIVKALQVVPWPREEHSFFSPLRAENFVCHSCLPNLCMKCRGKEKSRRRSMSGVNPFGISLA